MNNPLDRVTAALSDRYRIERELGAGGMATVYLAEDLKHERRVAIKVLKPELAAVIGAERFLREIKTIATLQHPHILGLIDSGEVNGTAYYVMPFVEGESLRDRLQREKQLPINDAVRLATEVAGALGYAHRHGVIHRDIKPENILLHDGSALVADFGIALAVSSAGGGSRMTETGMSLGTPHYMSPEQAMGEREITARSDVYALGAMMYEMLIGDPPFTGSTAQAIVAKVMTSDPAGLIAQRKNIPAAVEDAVLTALEKLPADRFASAAEFGAALMGGTGSTPARRTSARSSAPAGRRPDRATMLFAGMTIVFAALAAWQWQQKPGSSGPSMYDAAFPDSAPISFESSRLDASYGLALRALSVSSDAEFFVYAARQGETTAIWYRSLGNDESRLIQGTVGGTAPRVSPDGALVAFLLGDDVMVVPIGGGEPRRLLDGQNTNWMQWISPSQLLAIDIDGNRISELDPAGNTSPGRSTNRCAFGQRVSEHEFLCSANRMVELVDPASPSRLTIRRATGDSTSAAMVTGSAFRIVEGRYMVSVTGDGALTAASYDPATQRAGRSVRMVQSVRREAIGEDQFDIAANGTLVYAPGVDAAIGRMVRLAPGTIPTPLPIPPGDFQRYDLSRDGRWFAAVVQGVDGAELRQYDIRTGQQFTWLRAEQVRHVLWSPDGQFLVAAVRSQEQWSVVRGAPSSGRAPDTVVTMPLSATNPDPIDQPSERLIIAQDWSGGSMLFRFDPTMTEPRFDTVLTGGRFASVSPSGNRILYQTIEGSRVVTTSFPTPGRQWQVASEGREPLWLSDTEVVYRLGVSWYVVRVDPLTGEPVGAPTVLGRDPRFSDTAGWSNRLSHDGGIIYVQGPAQVTGTHVRVIPNWVAQMKRAVDEANR